jgi:hypothetical protein
MTENIQIQLKPEEDAFFKVQKFMNNNKNINKLWKIRQLKSKDGSIKHLIHRLFFPSSNGK